MAKINLHGVGLNTKIYRILKEKHLASLFKDRTNVLVSPSMWEDPFENFILNLPVDVHGEKGVFGFHDDFYGQCWSLHKASDAMWRIYSPDKGGIRIRTTIGKLYASLVRATGSNSHFAAHIGKVKYLGSKSLKDYCKKGVILDSAGAGIAETLLIKRRAFVHEKEVRLLYFASAPVSGKTYRYDLDPHELVDQFMLDPRLDADEFKKAMDRLRKATAFDGPIKRSLLYAPPKGFQTSAIESSDQI